MGSFGWDKLLTSPPFSYESGAFIAAQGHARRTAVGNVIRDLATAGHTTNPAAFAKPWWTLRSAGDTGGPQKRSTATSREALVLGGSGSLGTAIRRACEARGIRYCAPGRLDLDITDVSAVRDAITALHPLFVVNAAGYVRVDDAEHDETSCFLANVTGATVLARECARRKIPFVTFSSDLVFDGMKRSPYVESDRIAPLNVYGLSKQQSERDVLESNPRALIVRSSAFFGPWDESNFATLALRRMAEKSPVLLPSAATVSPTYLPDLADSSLDLLLDGEAGVWHLANSGALTWKEFATALASRTLQFDEFSPPSMELPGENKATHPLYSALASERGTVMPTLDNAIDRYITEVSNRLFAPASP
jgi:dTDP-4-dehydrorhamnose reductase